ncbi:MAG: acetate--CoA ligase family protein [Desulfobacca sp.]|uniref:acetate--CoA ligase family protein n=1 Tax=Desulfobacca sp. TaxID=2067990 RepID=UPI00404A49B3
MDKLFSPQAVVLVGVSRRTGVGAYNGLEMLQRYGYQGRIYVVHPQAEEILGHRVYPRVEDLPEVPDLAVIAVGRDLVLSVVEECLAKGIRWLVIISQGFADADTQGRQLQAKLVAAVRRSQAHLIGPNTMGVLNAHAHFTTAFVDLICPAEPPPVSLVAQSGAPQVGAESFTGPLGKAVDLGNAADIGFPEVLEYLETDPQTQVIALHIEGLSQGRGFLNTAARVNRRKPIVVLKTGSSPAGAQAALSHTGSLVGQDQVFTAACRRAGLTRVHSAQELQDTILAFRQLPPLRGPKVGIATPSGALGIIALDALSREGLQPGPVPERIIREVEPQGPYWHALHNPVDLWPIGMLTGDFLRIAGQTIAAFLEDDQIDGVLCMLPAIGSPLHSNLLATPAFFAGLNLDRYQKPLTVALYGDARERVRQSLSPVPGLACYFSVEQAVHALGQLYRYHQAVSRPSESWPEPSADNPGRLSAASILLGQEALDFLAGHGIPTVPGVLTHSPEAAVQAAAVLGFPVVLKVISPDYIHKSDQGGVILNLQDESAVRSAWQRLHPLLRTAPTGAATGILVQSQLTGRELLLGLKQDPTFGPVIVCGYGGTYTEIWQDTAQTLAPLTLAQAQELLASLRSFPLLQGYRNEPAVDLPAVCQAMVNLANLGLAYPRLQELDLNPLIATPQGCFAVDARLIWQI